MRRKPQFRPDAITFDVGGTLIKPWPSVGHVYAEVAARHGVKNVPPEELNSRFSQAWKAVKDFNHARTEWAGLVDASFGFPVNAKLFSDIYERFAEADAWHVFEDVVPTLESLSASGIKLGVISNWDERLKPLLRALELEDYFDVIVVSCEVGFPKPSPIIFQQAAEKLGVAPGAILHVGDSFEMDVEGARGAGFEALELRREGAGEMTSLLNLATIGGNRRR
jgi:putative hydrolase of the HAD superfamily